MNNNNYRPTVLVVNADFAFGIKKDHELITLLPDVVTAAFEKEAAINALKGVVADWKKAFTVQSDYVEANAVFLGMNPARDGWQNGNSRESDMRRLGRGLATLEVSLIERKAKRLAKDAWLSIQYDGDLPRLPFDDDGKPFAFYKVEEIEKGVISSYKYEKVSGAFPKKATVENETRDQWALRLPINSSTHTMDKTGIAHLLNSGTTFFVPGKFKDLVAQSYKIQRALLLGDMDTFNGIRAEIAERQKKAALAYALKKGETVIDF